MVLCLVCRAGVPGAVLLTDLWALNGLRGAGLSGLGTGSGRAPGWADSTCCSQAGAGPQADNAEVVAAVAAELLRFWAVPGPKGESRLLAIPRGVFEAGESSVIPTNNGSRR